MLNHKTNKQTKQLDHMNEWVYSSILKYLSHYPETRQEGSYFIKMFMIRISPKIKFYLFAMAYLPLLNFFFFCFSRALFFGRFDVSLSVKNTKTLYIKKKSKESKLQIILSLTFHLCLLRDGLHIYLLLNLGEVMELQKVLRLGYIAPKMYVLTFQILNITP